MKEYCYKCMREIKPGESCGCGAHTAAADEFPHRLRPGTVLNSKYLVGECLGEGGFGITYIGRDLTLDCVIAIKEYYPTGYVNRNVAVSPQVRVTSSSDDSFFTHGRERFLYEARNIAKFSGEPGIVGVKDYFEQNGTAYIIMDYLDGDDLSVVLRRDGVFKPEEIFGKILPIVDSLRRIHEAGVIHRDVTPNNIMMLRNGTLRLMDFGSARYYTGEDKELSVMIKQGYAPEEQYRKNGRQGPWTDVYGLCATLYKCVTGVTPVDALDRLRTDDLKKPSELGAEISAPLEQILMYGLEVYSENRCHDMAELASLIESALKDGSARPDRRRPADDNDKTMIADDQYKTAAADHTYGDHFSGRPDTPADSTKNKKKRSPVALIIIAVLLILAAVCYMIYLAFTGALRILSESSPDSESATAAVSEATVEPTQAASESGKVIMPNVVGKKASQAGSELYDLGLNVQIVEEVSETVAAGYVISQLTEPDTQVNKGDTVIIVVAKEAPTYVHISTEAPARTDAPEDISSDEIEAEIAKIREYYYSPTAADAKITLDKGANGIDYSRDYRFHNGRLVFAFLFDGEMERRLYFKDDQLIRYIDEDRDTYDHPDTLQFDGLKILIVSDAYYELDKSNGL